MTRHATVAADPVLAEHCPIVSHTAAQIGDPQVRHRGTIGGTLSHGDPASDMPAVMLALGAELVARGKAGERVIPATEFFTERLRDGARRPTRCSSRRACRSSQPRRDGPTSRRTGAPRTGRRSASQRSCIATTARSPAHRSVSSTWAGRRSGLRLPRMRSLAARRSSDAAELVTEGAEPPADHAGSSEYRAHLAQVIARRALEEATAD